MATTTVLNVEAEYISNLQQQIYFLELEANFLRKQTKKATALQPRITSEAELMFQKLREMQSQAEGLRLELKRKEASLYIWRSELEQLRSQISLVEDGHSREKQSLVKEIIQLKQTKEQTDRQVSQKETEILLLRQELERELNNENNKAQQIMVLQSKLKQKSEQQKAMEMQMSEKSMEILKVQSGIHEIEEKIQQRAAAMHEQITRDLRNEITRLHQQLRERTLQAEQDRLLKNKRMEDSSTIAKENAALESQLLEINKQLDIEQCIKEENLTSHSSSITQLLTVKDHGEQLQSELKRQQALLEEEKSNFKDCMEKIHILDKRNTSLAFNVATASSQIAELKALLAKEEQDNTQLRRDKTLLVDLASNLQTQLSNKEKELLQTSTRIEKLNEDVSALISKHNLHHSLEPEGWQEIYGITHSIRSPSISTSNLVAGLDRRIIDIEISK
uniref:Cingulin-like protein 1 isoform X2 n=1 Tax=Geotrypetes seraphini TaxID=260995 RepID=A0A6P8PTE4_GEOSA|nr:cingulin-like protein 1 isoform X2 [Geotrypetes seraphini]XP_033791522.1 cingulin-like protein 1 isoform X2 [Geotrypetes seraphini]